MSEIKIFCVGGTIDKVYFDAKSKYEIGVPSIASVLHDHDVGLSYKIESLMAKDSLDMQDHDRAVIHGAVSGANEDKIIITHGTDTMVNTAQVLSDIKGKTIVITGALAPAIFKNSDAIFNVGCALAAVQVAKNGVYIAMNGKIFDFNKVTKDVENNRFIES